MALQDVFNPMTIRKFFAQNWKTVSFKKFFSNKKGVHLGFGLNLGR